MDVSDERTRMPRRLVTARAFGWGRSVWSWGARHRDLLLAIGLFGLALISQESSADARQLDVLGVLLLAAATLPLMVWRRHPLAVLGVVAAALVAHGAIGYAPTSAWLALACAAYGVASLRGPRIAFSAVAASAAAAIGAPVLSGTQVGAEAFFGGLALFALPTMLGDRVYARRMAATTAVRDERERIARELHDSVAHALSVMVIQVDAAQAMINTDPTRANQALEAIRRTGRESLAEMRQMLGHLRTGDEHVAKPGVADLPALVAATREAGFDAQLDMQGQVVDLPPLADLSAYRIVQEALTNVRRHARATSAQVMVSYGADRVTIRVSDDGRGPQPNPTGGHGLAGMAERARLCGGSLQSGTGPDGGFVVTATLPTGAGRR